MDAFLKKSSFSKIPHSLILPRVAQAGGNSVDCEQHLFKQSFLFFFWYPLITPFFQESHLDQAEWV
jgi:hypothetical protein